MAHVPIEAGGLLTELRSRLGPELRAGEPLRRHTSIRIGGPADLFFVARSAEELERAVAEAHRLDLPWRVLGSGSNLLIADAGMDGLVIKATAPGSQIHVAEDAAGTYLEADAGAILAAVGKQAALRGLAGLEWAVNVPGTVGASVVNNSGAFGSSVAERLVSARIYQPEVGVRWIDREQLAYGYRASALKEGRLVGVVLAARYRVAPGDRSQLLARIAEIQAQRRATQPAGYSLGSIFANPPGDAAGRLSEAAGLKGFRVGDAEVSSLHANFIVNRGRATAQDVVSLMRHVQSIVWTQNGIWLRPEIQLTGRFGSEVAAAFDGPTERVG